MASWFTVRSCYRNNVHINITNILNLQTPLLSLVWEDYYLKLPKFEHIFVAVIIFPPLFCADIFDTNLLLIVRALR